MKRFVGFANYLRTVGFRQPASGSTCIPHPQSQLPLAAYLGGNRKVFSSVCGSGKSQHSLCGLRCFDRNFVSSASFPLHTSAAVSSLASPSSFSSTSPTSWLPYDSRPFSSDSPEAPSDSPESSSPSASSSQHTQSVLASVPPGYPSTFPLQHSAPQHHQRVNKTLQDRLEKSLVRMALIARKRNSFEQLLLSSLRLWDVMDGGLTAEFVCEVTQEMCHYEGILHSGVTCALATNVTGLHASSVDQQRRIVLSVDVNVSYLNKCSVGDKVHIRSHILKLGRSYCLAEAHLFRHVLNGVEQLAAGRHSMLFTGTPGQAGAFQREEASDGGCDFM